MMGTDVALLVDSAPVILLDIEGTTTSISFVKDVLFPYVRINLEEYLISHWGEPELLDDIKALRKQAQDDVTNGVEDVKLIPESTKIEEVKSAILDNVLQQMDKDRKTTALKQLQGHIWRTAYQSNSIKGHVYPDVVPALQHWCKKGKRIYIYSSGSVEAQKLLFGYSEEGDLLQYFSGHFDTLVGNKTESSSYAAIANTIGIAHDKVVFFTDVVKEAKAAVSSGMNALLVEREGNQPLTEDDKCNYPTITSFKEALLTN